MLGLIAVGRVGRGGEEYRINSISIISSAGVQGGSAANMGY